MSTNGFGHSRVHDSDDGIEIRQQEQVNEDNEEYDEEGSVVSSIVDRYDLYIL